VVNHPNRGGGSFQFIAYDMITGLPQAHAKTAGGALALAAEHLPNADFIEVLDCGDNGKKVWTGGSIPTNPVPLYKARPLHRTVFRGAGYAENHNPFPAVPLAEG
jgi:hypothetical protein